MTIEERAKEKGLNSLTQKDYEVLNCTRRALSAFEMGYILGATEQQKIDEEEQGKALLYAVHKTAERTKKEMSQKALDLMMHWIFGNAPHEVYDDFMSDYSDLMKTLED